MNKQIKKNAKPMISILYLNAASPHVSSTITIEFAVIFPSWRHLGFSILIYVCQDVCEPACVKPGVIETCMLLHGCLRFFPLQVKKWWPRQGARKEAYLTLNSSTFTSLHFMVHNGNFYKLTIIT